MHEQDWAALSALFVRDCDVPKTAILHVQFRPLFAIPRYDYTVDTQCDIIVPYRGETRSAYLRLLALILPVRNRNPHESPAATHISIIVNRNFGSRLFQLADYSHVWVCNSPANRVTPDQLANCNANASDERSLHVFQAGKKESPEAMLGRILNQAVAAHTKWRDILVHGVMHTKEVEAKLRAAGAGNVYKSQEGVYATR